MAWSKRERFQTQVRIQPREETYQQYHRVIIGLGLSFWYWTLVLQSSTPRFPFTIFLLLHSICVYVPRPSSSTKESPEFSVWFICLILIFDNLSSLVFQTHFLSIVISTIFYLLLFCSTLWLCFCSDY